MIKNVLNYPVFGVNKYSEKPTFKSSFGVKLPSLQSDCFTRSASSIEHSLKMKPINVAKIGNVSFGSSERELQVLNKLNSQLMDVNPSEVQEVIGQLPSEDKELGLKVLKRATQFGNFESLNGLYRSILDKKSQGYDCFSFATNRVNSLIENMSYLNVKKAFPSDPSTPIDYDTIFYRKKGAFLLDKNILSRLENDSDLRNHIKRNDFKLFYPEGWDSGITAFNLTTIGDIKEKTYKLVDKTKEYKMNGVSEETAVERALIAPVYEKLSELGLENKLEVLNNPDIDFSEEPCCVDIAKQLESKKMTQEEFSASLPDSDYTRGPALDILDNDGKVLSMRELGLTAQKINSEVTSFAKERGISEDNIYYVIPRINKSYGLIALQYQQINDIPEKQFRFAFNKIENADEDSLLVILDDYAGSGDSLKNDYYDLRKNNSCNIILAPCVATKMGLKSIKNRLANDEKANVICGQELEAYFYSKEYNSKTMKYPYFDLIGKGGWGNTQANIAFPYMSPDNNTKFFADCMASHYTFNSAGVKKSDSGSNYD